MNKLKFNNIVLGESIILTIMKQRVKYYSGISHDHTIILPNSKNKFSLNKLITNESLKSVNPKISRIGQQKRKNDFFLFGQKNPFGYLFSKMTSKGPISFSFLRNLQNLKIRLRGLQRRPWDLKFDTCLTCS